MAIDMAWTAGPTDVATRPGDEAAIRACLLDYFEGWFDGDVGRMDRALHPGLAKHSLGQNKDRAEVLDITTKDEMVELTRQGMGRRRDLADRAIRVDVLRISGNTACAAVESAVYTEFALLLRTSAGWQISSTAWHWATGHGPRA